MPMSLTVFKYANSTGHNAALYAMAKSGSPDGLLSAGGDGWIVAWAADDPDKGRLVASVGTRIFSLLALPDMIVAGNMDGGVHFIQTGVANETRNVQLHQKGVFDLLHTQGKVLSAGGEGKLNLWSLRENRSTESLHLSNRSLRCLAANAQETILAIGASDGHVYLFDLQDFRLIKTIQAAHESSVFTVAWHPNAPYLLTGGRDAMLRVWYVEKDFSLHLEIPAHWFTVNHIAFSPDGRFFVSASRDKTLKLWDAQSFELLKVLDTIRYGAHINSVNKVLWLDGQHFVSCSDDRTMMWWQLG